MIQRGLYDRTMQRLVAWAIGAVLGAAIVRMLT
jgi:hypothetical protein